VPQNTCDKCNKTFLTPDQLAHHKCSPPETDSCVTQKKSTDAREPIQTLVFFDLETNGLIERDTFPDIVEFACIAVHREDLTNAARGGMPRVVDKLRLTLKPQQALPYSTTFITGR
jgi:DNA polymerase III alpha subunit (gram-positive type)